MRLRPCDALARVAHVEHRAGAEFEVEVARRLGELDAPVAPLDPRVEPRAYVRDGFVVNFWTYCEPTGRPEVAAAEYVQALESLHAGMRHVDLDSPHFTDRVAEAERLIGDPARTPELGDADRELLAGRLRRSTLAIGRRGPREQLLHGEPHPGNILDTARGLLFVDLETCCRGPVEFDVAHLPDEVGSHYPGLDAELLRECRILTLAMIAAWRWDRDDRFPDGRRMGLDLLEQIRAMR